MNETENTRITFIEETLIELYANFGYTQSSIERALDLKMNTLSTKDPSYELLILIKMIKIYPWLIEVADKNYDKFEAKRILGHNAVNLAVNMQANKKL